MQATNQGQAYQILRCQKLSTPWELLSNLLQLLMQSVPITTKVVSQNPIHGVVYSIQLYVIKFVSDWQHVGSFLQVSLVFSTSKTYCQDIIEILLKVALNTITLTQFKCLAYDWTVNQINERLPDMTPYWMLFDVGLLTKKSNNQILKLD